MKTEFKYINCVVTTHDGNSFSNPLKLSEAHLISKLVQENKLVQCTLDTVTKQMYKLMFN